jgi:hypothetical protein
LIKFDFLIIQNFYSQLKMGQKLSIRRELLCQNAHREIVSKGKAMRTALLLYYYSVYRAMAVQSSNATDRLICLLAQRLLDILSICGDNKQILARPLAGSVALAANLRAQHDIVRSSDSCSA